MEIIVAGAVGLYIVFFTRPAHPMVANLLSSTVAQIAALAAVIYVGACHSLIVAVVLAVAVVLSSPSREHLVNAPGSAGQNNTITAAASASTSPTKKVGTAATTPSQPAPSSGPVKPATSVKDKSKENFDLPDELASQMNMGSDSIAAAGQDIPAVKPESKGSESFSLMSAAPF